LIHKASLNTRCGHWQSNERPIILFDWPRRRTSAPRREICWLFQSIRLKLGSRGAECEATYISRLVVTPGEAEPFDRCTSQVTAADTIRRGRAWANVIHLRLDD
jgi:hypothetical protein